MIGALARSILAQAHAMLRGGFHDGPFYVKYDRGTFYLYPFGPMANYRFCYRVDPDPLHFSADSREWVFNVLWTGRE